MSSDKKIPSDNASTASSHSSRRKNKAPSALPLIKKDHEEMVVMFNQLDDSTTSFPRIFGEEPDDSVFMCIFLPSSNI